MEKRVLIAGGGPVGLVTALALAQQGIPVTVFEAEATLAIDQRAGSFHPPTMDMLEPLGIAAEMKKTGIKIPRWQMRDRKEGLIVEWDLGVIADVTHHPYRLHLEQHRLTPIALDLLKPYAHAQVHFSHAVGGIEARADGVTVTCTTPDGPRSFDGTWLIGCDGGRSAVRKWIGTEFEGFTWPERFIVISTPYDIGQHGYTGNAYIADPDEWIAIFQMPHEGPPGLWRFAMPVVPAHSDEFALAPTEVQRRLKGFLPARGDNAGGDYEVPYCGIYKVHQRVAKEWRKGRVVLAGDAAHINNPLGAFGLNGGIHDAINLSEKLGAVWRGEQSEDHIDLYVRQRRTANIEFVQSNSIRNKEMMEERDPAKKQQCFDELRARAADPALAREAMLVSSMIGSVRRAAQIT